MTTLFPTQSAVWWVYVVSTQLKLYLHIKTENRTVSQIINSTNVVHKNNNKHSSYQNLFTDILLTISLSIQFDCANWKKLYVSRRLHSDTKIVSYEEWLFSIYGLHHYLWYTAFSNRAKQENLSLKFFSYILGRWCQETFCLLFVCLWEQREGICDNRLCACNYGPSLSQASTLAQHERPEKRAMCLLLDGRWVR